MGEDKPILWVGSSLDDLRAFPEDARRIAGFELRRVQQGLQPTDWKPMGSVGAGVEEIRVHTGQEHRVFYIARFEEGVYVLHAFEKRSRKTPATEIELARTRLREVLAGEAEVTMTHKIKSRVTRATGNVFRDLGFPPDKAEHLLVRADLMIRLEKELGSRGLKQAQAAKLLGISQPRVSDLLRGRVELFSADTLIDMLARLGIKVRLVASTRARVA